MRPRDDSAPRHRRPTRTLGRRAPAASAVAVLVLGGGVTAGVVAASRSGPEPAVDRTQMRLTPADLGQGSLLRVTGSRGGAGSLAASPDAAASARAAAVPARGSVVRAAAVLRAWDERRARAWAEGDADALRDLYVDEVGAADVRLLRRYADRGYRVEGMTTQLLAVVVLERAPDRWRLRVTDRLASAVAVRGRERIRLPTDRADTHVVTLVRTEDGLWRVAQVRARGRLQAPTGRSAQRRSE